MAIEQLGLGWHGASKYNGHIRGPMTLTPIAKRLAVEMSLPDSGLSWLEFEHPTFRLRGELSNPMCHHHIPWGRGSCAGA